MADCRDAPVAGGGSGARSAPCGDDAASRAAIIRTASRKPTASSSETDISRSGSNPERRSKQAAETVRRLFKAAVKAITPRDPDAPQPQKKRSGEKHGGGLMMLRQVMRAAGRPAARGRYGALRAAATDACSVPEDWLHSGNKWDVFDITGLHYEHGFDGGSARSFDTKSDYLSPGL